MINEPKKIETIILLYEIKQNMNIYHVEYLKISVNVKWVLQIIKF